MSRNTPEGRVKAAVVKVLKSHGAGLYYFFPQNMGMGASGVPDIICCFGGRFLAIECKAGKNKPTDLQKLHIDRINAAGGTAVVINEDNLNYLDGIIKLLKD